MTTALIILDGWGYNPSPEHNAIHCARSPHWDRLWTQNPQTLISGSGVDVGLPDGQMGNSEVGHITLGSGRVVEQSLSRINKAIEEGSFYNNPAYLQAINASVGSGKALHILGLLSPGGIHSHERHIEAILNLAIRHGCSKLYVHAFLDGRDVLPRSAEASLRALQRLLDERGSGRIASIVGRYFAMDRDNRWERTAAAYRLIVQGQARFSADDAVAGLHQAYSRDESDEFVQPTLIGSPVSLEEGDAVIFMNFRADRARQISRALTDSSFSAFKRARVVSLSQYVMTTDYGGDIQATIAFVKERLDDNFGAYIAAKGLSQLRIAETEKYAHVTFFFSGGEEKPYRGEQRQLIPSPKVSTYDLQPEMSAVELTDQLVEAIDGGRFDAIISNFANGDMVGHTGNFEAAVKAVEAVDACLGYILEALDRVKGHCLITADHGNIEQMFDPTSGQALTSHTKAPVPLIYHGPNTLQLRRGGTLADVAPTLLDLMGLPKPVAMTGNSLIKR